MVMMLALPVAAAATAECRYPVCVVLGSDLESVIEEIRKDVVGRRCRVNISEVEKLALALSHLSRSLASLKGLSLSLCLPLYSLFRRCGCAANTVFASCFTSQFFCVPSETSTLLVG